MRNESSNDTEREKISNSDSRVTPVPMSSRTCRISGMSMKELRAEIRRIDRIDSADMRRDIEHAYAVLDMDSALIWEKQYNDYRNRLCDAVDCILKADMEAGRSRRNCWKGPGWLRVIRSWKLDEVKCCREILGDISGERVIWDLTKVIDYDQNASFAYEARGIARAEQDEFELALADFTQAMTLNPKNAGVHINRGIAYSMNDNEELGMQDFNAAIALDPTFAECYSARGLAHFFREEFKEALSDFGRAITIDPMESKYYTNRGNIYAELGEKELAIIDYTTAIFMNRKDACAYANRGFVLYEKGWFRRAVRDLSKAINLGVSTEKSYLKRAEAYRALGEYIKADQDVLWALELAGKCYKG